jgi:CheY-like chemotaxis protein
MVKKGAIIVIEDDHDDQQILRDIFKELNVKNEILFFDESNTAYNHLMSITEKPFIIICDINMPKMNGIELKQRIDSTDHLRKKAIPFVFLTTSDQQQTVDDAYRLTNLQGYFKKGTSMEEIKKRIHFIMEYWQEAVHPYQKS